MSRPPDLSLEDLGPADLEFADLGDLAWIDLGVAVDASSTSPSISPREPCDQPGQTRVCQGSRPPELEGCSAAFQRCEGGAWSRCQSAQERCNAIDDDCDGVTDEGYAVGEACEIGEGACSSAGVIACESGGDARCQATLISPAIERCDFADNDCDGRVDEDFAQLGRPCEVGVGECLNAGHVTCDALGGLRCDVAPLEPAEERCDGLDNDCDQRVDEGDPSSGEACESGYQGECNAGVTRCREGRVFCEPASLPQQERCDQLDNDCDGRVDEEGPPIGSACVSERFGVCQEGAWACDEDGGWRCASTREPLAERCDLIDNDCDGVVDEELNLEPQACDTGIAGECGLGQLICVAGEERCAETVTPIEERCDGLDLDCDGAIDESDPLIGERCEVEGALGPCVEGAWRCAEGALSCESTHVLIEERCDGIDNDCDGEVDEAFVNLGRRCQVGEGVCTRVGRLACSPDGAELICEDLDVNLISPRSERCDGLDNDCDGVTDEAGGQLDDPLNCGACGHQCNEPRHLTACVAGVCERLGCARGWRDAGDGVVEGEDADGEDADGDCASACETLEVSEERCDGVDSDCDGAVDEGVCPLALNINVNINEQTTDVCAQRAALGTQDALCASADASGARALSGWRSAPWFTSARGVVTWSAEGIKASASDAGPDHVDPAAIQRPLIGRSRALELTLKVRLGAEPLTVTLSRFAHLFPAAAEGRVNPELAPEVRGLSLTVRRAADGARAEVELTEHPQEVTLWSGVTPALTPIDDEQLLDLNLRATLSAQGRLELTLAQLPNQPPHQTPNQTPLLARDEGVEITPLSSPFDELTLSFLSVPQLGEGEPGESEPGLGEAGLSESAITLIAARFDEDEDGVYAPIDNCPWLANPDQADRDENGVGRACDDADRDGFEGGDDLCPLIPSSAQLDVDGDGRGDLCEGLGGVVISDPEWGGPWARALDLETGQRRAVPIPADGGFSNVSHDRQSGWWSAVDEVGVLSFASASATAQWRSGEASEPERTPYDLSGWGAYLDGGFYRVLTDQRTVTRAHPELESGPESEPEERYRGALGDWLTIRSAQGSLMTVERDAEGERSLFTLSSAGEVVTADVPLPSPDLAFNLARWSERPRGFVISGESGSAQGLLLLREGSSEGSSEGSDEESRASGGTLESYDEEPVLWFGLTPAPRDELGAPLSERGGALIFRENPLYLIAPPPRSEGAQTSAYWTPSLSLGGAEWSPLFAIDLDLSGARFSAIEGLSRRPDRDHDGVADVDDACPSHPLAPQPTPVTDGALSGLDPIDTLYASADDPRVFVTRSDDVRPGDLALALRSGEGWMTHPLPTARGALNVVLSDYQGERIQHVRCGGRGWLLASDGFDELLTLLEVDRELRVIRSVQGEQGAQGEQGEQLIEALNIGLPDQLSEGIELPEHAVSPAYLSCEEGTLVISQVWLERKVQSGFGIETYHLNLARFSWDMTAEEPTSGILEHLSEVTERAHSHTLRDGTSHAGPDQWVSLSVDDDGGLWLERWASDGTTSGAVQLTAPSSKWREPSLIITKLSERGALAIGLIDRYGALWASAPSPLDELSAAPGAPATDGAPSPAPSSEFRLRHISGLLESIQDVRLAIDGDRTLTLFNARRPLTSQRAIYLSTLAHEAPIEGPPQRLSRTGGEVRSLWFSAAGGAYEHIWSDSVTLWRATGATPCP